MKYSEMNKEQLLAEKEKVSELYNEFKSRGLKLTMARGVPAPEQLDLSINMLLHCLDGDYKSKGGADCRSYGVLDGIPEAKELFMEMLGVNEDEIIVGGNSSLQMMYDTIIRAMQLGVLHSEKPWCKYDSVKFLCPAPGYDRHFAMCQALGIEMITVPYKPDGPDMDMIEKLVAEDETIKGVWCVPLYSNPTGISYSDEVVRRFANLKPKAKDFRIFWDNAYSVHHLYDDDQDEILNIIRECEKAGNPDMVFEFSSTSKISFPGGGLAVICASKDNISLIKSQMAYQTIGFDKLNQLRHVKYFKNFDGIRKHMKAHAAIIRPKFEVVMYILEKELAPLGIGEWTNPKGGYFISFDAPEGTAKRIVSLAKDAGVVMTNAGATYPYEKDPRDSNIRIAPTYPSADDLRKAMELFCVCVRMAYLEAKLS
ncbi:MAG: aminotransferase class I/II-fold pyridoxal phosphate-dependent enzyme [Oscillospiraceae bacterium]|nr:aminotransferase class I/II-fold pyridoxal phosphate-dependent enzyme [Oscillospiraceae bacterium]